MPKFTVWTNVTDKKTIDAADPREAASKYHEMTGNLTEKWDGALHVRDEHGEEWSYRRRQAA